MKGNIKINPLEGKMKFLTLIAIIWTCLLIIFTNLNTATSSPQYKISSLSLDEWNYRKPIWIQADQVDENLTNFPVLIQINDDNDLASHAQNDFDDICFVNENCTIKLNHEIEAFDSINGNLTAWVNIPFLSNTSNTTIYMYYGNPTCDTQENSTGVWDSHYKGVWHMAEVNADDSTCYNNDGTESGGVLLNLSGKIGRATEFDGIDDNINVGNDNSIKPELPITISCWINAKNIDGSVYQFIFNNDKCSGYYSYFGAHIGIMDKISIGYGDGGVAAPWSRRGKTATTILSENCWYYIVGIIRGATDMDLYLNGVNDGGTYDGSGGSIHYSSSSGYIAQGGYNNDFFHGVIDEVRISDIARNESWIKTSYNNQNNPSAFIEIGVEEYMGNLSVVYVDDDFNISTPGWQYNHFDKIQDGIDAVNENGTVYVFNGTYYENVVINKTIHLIGEDRNGTIIDGGGNGNVIKITENWVIVKNFRLQNSGNDSNSAGLKIENSINSVISNISCSDNNNYGIHIYNSEPFLRSIHVYNNSKTGVYVYFNQNCENAHTPKINNLTVKNNGEYGIEVYAHVGYIWPGIDREYHAIITNSTISENTNYGIYLHCYATGPWSGPWVVEGKLYTTIKNCIISDCRGGITTYHDHGPYGISYLYMALQNTTIINNTERGVILRNIGVQEDSTSVKNNGIVDWCGSGYTFGNWTWHNESIYNFNGTIEINSGHVLTIEAGTTVIFEGNDTELFVKGAINATGDENHRIYFTSNKKEWKGIF
ncbi:MAG TPA: DUF2341 domain-containing protein, partial [Thermoplasmatales archaeon]|nr:DUF2341 domain-containing protein [Thermoplasmatales archaeon]